LPRIAICYFVVSVLYLISPSWKSKVVIAVAALVGYWALMRFVSVPGYGVPTHSVALLDPDGNLVAWADRQIFAASHLYEQTRDPEGLISTLPALATALFGMVTGLWLRTNYTFVEKARGVAIAGVSSVLLGAAWSLEFPINKKLWTSSYVLFAAGWSLLLLALAIWLVDIQGKGDIARQRKRYMVLLVLGMNSIAAYVFSELLPGILYLIRIDPKTTLRQWIYHGITSAITDPALASLAYSLGFVAVCWLAMYPLYRNKIFLKI